MKILSIVAGLLLMMGCRQQSNNKDFSAEDISRVIAEMTNIMVHDVTNPPLASRFFSYACLSGYEVISQNKEDVVSMHGRLTGYPLLKKQDTIQGYSYQLAAILAMMETAKKMQPSGKLLDTYEKRFLDSCGKAGWDQDKIVASKKYAIAISREILSYARKDLYNRISNYPRYTPLGKEGYWYPTPPAYIAAVEPYFKTLRPFTLDSSTQFKPEPPVPFSIQKSSSFFKMMMQNYEDSLSNEKKLIAAYWDCNPFAVQDNGHLLVGLKKISPGAHWLGITGIVCKSDKKNFDEAMQIHTAVSIGLMDAFICCWEEKYKSNRIRPETAIRKYIDPTWQPFLQTPPFPEYVSGHSTISAASATILGHYFGENFSFRDTVEMTYGLPARNFKSFKQAAQEAAISRFYGGIHFMDAIDNGFRQGEKIGSWVLKKLGKEL